jgi:phospholipid/cholesterol/gamma-HCH transport system substrate-binding protein
VTIVVIIIIWVGAANVFLKGSTYVTYFDESVQGLQADSAVKYRGVEIGKVESIKVAPDYRLIEVAMKISLAGDLQQQVAAQLKTIGITGIVFIELDQIKPDDLSSSPKITFKTNYQIIPSRPSEISRFLSDADKVMQNMKEIDFKGISGQLKSITKSIDTFLAGKRMNHIMANLESTSSNLDKLIANVSKTINEGKVDNVLKETAKTLSDARQLINLAKEEISSMKLKELDKRTQSIAISLQDTADNLRTTSENLYKLSESLNNSPSELLFQKPAPPKKIME